MMIFCANVVFKRSDDTQILGFAADFTKVLLASMKLRLLFLSNHSRWKIVDHSIFI